MAEQKFVYVDVNYLKELEEKAKKADYYKGIIDGINMVADRKTEPNSSEKPNNYEPKICDFCRYYNSNIPCGSTPSACKEADKFAEEFVDGLKKLQPKTEPFDKDINVRSKDEPQMDYTPDCPFCKRYGTDDCLGSDCRHYKTYKDEQSGKE